MAAGRIATPVHGPVVGDGRILLLDLAKGVVDVVDRAQHRGDLPRAQKIGVAVGLLDRHPAQHAEIEEFLQQGLEGRLGGLLGGPGPEGRGLVEKLRGREAGTSALCSNPSALSRASV